MEVPVNGLAKKERVSLVFNAKAGRGWRARRQRYETKTIKQAYAMKSVYKKQTGRPLRSCGTEGSP